MTTLVVRHKDILCVLRANTDRPVDSVDASISFRFLSVSSSDIAHSCTLPKTSKASLTEESTVLIGGASGRVIRSRVYTRDSSKVRWGRRRARVGRVTLYALVAVL